MFSRSDTGYMFVNPANDDADDIREPESHGGASADSTDESTTVVEREEAPRRTPDPILSDQAATPQFRLLELLGTGASSRVYVAATSEGCVGAAQRKVVVKILDADYGGQHIRALDYERSLRRIERIEHPNVVSVEAWGRTLDDRIYTVMPYDDRAHDLRAWIRPGSPLPIDDVADLARQILDGLHRLHRGGLVHGDVKPSNCLLHPSPIQPRVELIDFTATLFAGKARLVLLENRDVIGTPSYMAPEREERITGSASDLYGAGVMMYELLTGDLPYRAKSKRSLMRMHKQLPVPEATRRVPSLPASADDFFDQALAKTPERRFHDARAMSRAFARVLADADRVV